MEGSLGTALRNARLEKKITIEEAARVTKIRPERIADLECDEYTRFPSLAYARSFLILYAKYLQFDVSKYQTMDVGNPAGVGDYQYLQNESGVDSLRFTRAVEAPPPKPILFRALLIFVAAAFIGVFSAYMVLTVSRLPVDDLVKKHQKDDRAVLGAPDPTPLATATPMPVRKAIPLTSPQATGAPAAVPAATAPVEAPATPTPSTGMQMGGTGVLPAQPLTSGSEGVVNPPVNPAPAAAGTESTPGAASPEVRPALPVTGGSAPSMTPASLVSGSDSAVVETKQNGIASGPAPLEQGTSDAQAAATPTVGTPSASGTGQTPVAPAPAETGGIAAATPVPPSIPLTVPGLSGSTEAQPTATPTPKPAYEVRLRASKKVWVAVVRDDPNSAPIYEGNLTPGGPALTLKGNRLWIKPKDPKDRSVLKIWTDAHNVSKLSDGYRVP